MKILDMKTVQTKSKTKKVSKTSVSLSKQVLKILKVLVENGEDAASDLIIEMIKKS